MLFEICKFTYYYRKKWNSMPNLKKKEGGRQLPGLSPCAPSPLPSHIPEQHNYVHQVLDVQWRTGMGGGGGQGGYYPGLV